MKKIISLKFFFLILTISINAQKGINFLKIHGGAEIPVGFFNEGYKTGWGIFATDYYTVTPNKGSISISTGVTGWSAHDNPDFKSGLSITRVGYRGFITKGFYLQGDAGIAVYIGDWAPSPSKFTYSAGTGYLFANKNGTGFDISAKVNRIPLRTWVGLNIGYQFKL
jgi:hypothetical protein